MPSIGTPPQENEAPRLVASVRDLVKVYSDGSVVRGPEPVFPAAIFGEDENAFKFDVVSKDVTIDDTTGLWCRLYFPGSSLDRSRSTFKLPVIVYYHWGGFIFFSAKTPAFDRYCKMLSSNLQVIVVSVNYRLAPENRLPAAYEDSLKVMQWLSGARTGDDWFDSLADLGKIVLMGESVGGNIVFHTLLMMAKPSGLSLVKGAVIIEPCFTGEVRTPSEDRARNKGGFNLEISDSLWRMALPAEANRDHPFANPSSVDFSCLEKFPMLGVIAGCAIHAERELQVFRQVQKCNPRLQVLECEDEDHGFALLKMNDKSSRTILNQMSVFLQSLP